jgi:hypothetical protein
VSPGGRTQHALPFESQGIAWGGGFTLRGGGAEKYCEHVEESGQVDQERGGSPIYLPHLAPQSLPELQAQIIFLGGFLLIYLCAFSSSVLDSFLASGTGVSNFVLGSPIYLVHLAPHSLPHSFLQLQAQPVFCATAASGICVQLPQHDAVSSCNNQHENVDSFLT